MTSSDQFHFLGDGHVSLIRQIQPPRMSCLCLTALTATLFVRLVEVPSRGTILAKGYLIIALTLSLVPSLGAFV